MGMPFHLTDEKQAESHRLAVWNTGVHLLFLGIRSELARRFEDRGAQVHAREFNLLSVDDFRKLVQGHPVRRGWTWGFRLVTPGVPPVERLASVGVPCPLLRGRLAGEPGQPALQWLARHPRGYPPWALLGAASPGAEQMTILGDRWFVARAGQVLECSPAELAARIAEDLVALTVPKTAISLTPL